MNDDIYTSTRPVHPLKALAPIPVIPSGIVNSLIAVQPENASFPISSLSLCRFTFSSFVQSEKVLKPILFTEDGNVISVRLLHSEKACVSILTTPDDIVTAVSPLHPPNASDSIVLTFDGIVTFSRPVHPANAFLPIVVKPLGILTLVRLVSL